MYKTFISVFCLFLPVFCFSAEIIPDDTNENWNILVTDLICMETDSQEAAYIGKTLSLAVFNHLSVLKTHRLSDDEVYFVQEFLKEQYLSQKRKTLNSYYQDYDKMLFKDNVSVSAKKTLENSIAREKKNIRRLEIYDPARIYLKKDRNIVYLNGNSGVSSSLLSPADLSVTASKYKADYIVWGNIKIVDEVVIIDLNVYSGILNRNIDSVHMADDIDSVYRGLGNKLTALYESILGTQWAMINIVMDNQNGNIFIDDIYSGTGNYAGLIVNPGEHTVKIAGNNMAADSKIVNAGHEEIINLDFQIKDSENELFAVSSFPSGADVYYNSIWQGQTPLFIQGSEGEVIISKSGYRDYSVFLEDTENNNIDAFPQKELFDKDDYILKKRNAFYRSLTFFVLSIPVPFFTYANYLAYDDLYAKSAAKKINAHEIRKNKKIRDYSRYAFYGSICLSTSLFVNAMIHLHDYIEAGDAATKR